MTSPTRKRTTDPRPAHEEPAEPTLAAVVRDRIGVSWSRARALCTSGRVMVDGERCLDPALRVPSTAVVSIDAGVRFEAATQVQGAVISGPVNELALHRPADGAR